MTAPALVIARAMQPHVITFDVPGRPVPAVRMTQAGVRSGNHRDRARMDRHLAWKDTVGRAARDFLRQHDWPFDEVGPLYQKQWLWCRIVVHIHKRGTADIENWQKLILDGCQGIIFDNDRWFDDIRTTVWRTKPGELEYVAITIGWLGER